ncbi:S-layer homology domain-containing protein [uncultured Veillonella sp.]|uniref:S-layer homology domain-containing protein n=1 Tax=uncultured Veillonella sp. TaxID=159268 RepID=UPI0025E4E8D8|nr:S-layer homology domain-containing protein [uncultured Veillonella sp.]MDY3973945.1 S-layer homology domain-containing protein [Veillonella caviae]
MKIKVYEKNNRKKLTALVLGTMYALGSVVTVSAATDYISVYSTQALPKDTGYNSIAIGPNSESAGENSLAAGNKAIAKGASSIATGLEAKAQAVRSIATGTSAQIDEVAANAIAIGYNANVVRDSDYKDNLSNGGKAKTSGQNAIAIGTNSYTSGSQAIAVGTTAKAEGYNSVAIGNGVSATGDSSTVIGDGAWGHGVKSTVYGQNAKVYNASIEKDANELKAKIDNLRIDNQQYKADLGELENQGNNAVAIGGDTKASGWGASALGYKAYALHSQATALGDDAKSMNYAASAVGTHSYASGIQATALGNGAEALGAQSAALGSGSAATGAQSLAAGWGAGASGKNAIALGSSTKSVKSWYTKGGETSTYATELAQWNASGDYSVAVGTDALANNTDTIAVGRNAASTEADSVAVGHNAKSSVAGGVALGSESVATRGALSDVMVTNTSSSSNNQVYGAANSTDTAKAAIAATVKGALGAVSVGNDGATRQITNVAAGSDNSDAVNVAQLKSVETSVREYVNANAVDVKQGNGITVTETPAGTDAEGNETKHTFTVALAEDVKNSITNNTNNISKLGDTVTNLNGQVQINTGDISNLKSQVANNTQTINTHTEQISDLNNRVNGVNGRINSLDNRMDKVGAGAAALAGLHPLDFNPDDKWSFSVGYGNYGNANAMAVGAFYRPNEDVMVNVASSMGNGENMVSAGLNFNIGQSSGVSRSRVAMAKEIELLKARIDQLEAQQRNQAKGNGVQSTNLAANVNFPDVPENHWAYEFVNSLAQRGLLVGYPDGEFKGNQSMTRYEFAAVIYRALQNGAIIDGNMARATEEFSNEMIAVEKADRFRVDLVHGKPSDRYKVERIRVNSEDKESRDVYGGYTKM